MKTNFFYRLACICGLLLLTAAFLTAQTRHDISVSNTVFTPDELTVMSGDTVVWTNIDGYHNVNGTQATFPANPESFGNTPGSGWMLTHVFTIPGIYDYQCDPHAGLGMTGKIQVVGEATISVAFTGMDPHAGQDLWMSVTHTNTGEEIGRVKTVASSAFTVDIPGVLTGEAYTVDFYVDFNENGYYDSPPSDHAWRMTIDELLGDSTLDFAHNTDFTEITWQHRIDIAFTGMTPHVDQQIYLALEDDEGEEITRAQRAVSESFTVSFLNMNPGNPHVIDFFADLNENGKYDPPPTDHAWRIELPDLRGDTTVNFVHNTLFTDIEWQHRLTLAFSGMTPHAGQKLDLIVYDSSTDTIAYSEVRTIEENFDVIIPVESGIPYRIDFFADFNENGYYDDPPVDHAWRLELDNIVGDSLVEFEHNTNFTDIMRTYTLDLNFTGMAPHAGQDLWLAVISQQTDELLTRTNTTVEDEFSMQITGLRGGESYSIDFFADFNTNEKYDSPPADHAWRLNLADVRGDTTLNFAHNTDFTDIMWMYMITVEFSAMDPHAGQRLWLSVTDTSTQELVYREQHQVTPEFSVMVPGIAMGGSYRLDFFADFNENGFYDAPPVDHAWRIDVDNIQSDTIIAFEHNTMFTDIDWTHLMTIAFSEMTPHAGQMLNLAVFDKSDDTQIYHEARIIEDNFDVTLPVDPSSSYRIDFFADFNENGYYDSPPTDHAWRLDIENVVGDTVVDFAHNTNFTDIMWTYLLDISFMGMSPHAGQELWLAIIDQESGEIVDRINRTVSSDFNILYNGLEGGHSYDIDFFADFNENGSYDAPPADHAWRLTLEDVRGDTSLNFTHNTDFTDIMWQHVMKIQFSGMDPHDGQDPHLYVYEAGSEEAFGTETVTATPSFDIEIYGILPGNYQLDFYADLNGNGSYDAPPADHAWRLEVNNVTGDTTVTFSHNTDFTDIFPQDPDQSITAQSRSLNLYPVPANAMIHLILDTETETDGHYRIYNISGTVVSEGVLPQFTSESTVDLNGLSEGYYILEIAVGKYSARGKLIISR